MLAGYNAHVGALFLLGDAEEWLNLDETIRARVTHITQFGDIKIAPER